MILPPTIETERLTLRPPTVADFDVYSETLGSERARFVGGPFDRRRAWYDFAAEAGGWIVYGYGPWSIVEKESGRFVGMVIFSKPVPYPDPELGWMLQAEAEGKGYAFEAAVAARDWARHTQNWPRLVSYIDKNNARSIALAEKLGAEVDSAAPESDDDPDMFVYVHPSHEAVAA
jgi:RimJ/RimL family protein N-acetyltransferase